jgi:putative tryptophan/tyrosine transport system substrate-binding protein
VDHSRLRAGVRTGKTRRFLWVVGATIGVLLQVAAGAQPAERTRQVGVLSYGTVPVSPEAPRLFSHFEEALRERGWVKGRNVEYRYSRGGPEQLADLARELAQLRPDVIVAHTNQAIAPAKGATATIPIVMVLAADPVGAGLVISLARPGGNVTGVTFDVGDEIWGKRLELLREAAPEVARVAVLWNPAYAPNRNRWKALEEAARKLSVVLVSAEAQVGGNVERWFELMAKERVRGLYVLGDPVLFGLRSQIADLALKHRLPSVSPYREGADAGGLIAYGVSLPGALRHAAQYVDKILKGAKPGELPVEQPNTFELVINVKTAAALGLAIPQSLSLRADHLLQ